MKATHLLDTSVYCQPIRKIPLPSVRNRWEALGDGCLCISIICEMEVLQGLRMQQGQRLWAAYAELLENRLPCLPVDLPVAKVYAATAAAMKAQGMTRPALDLLVASTAMAHDLTLATCNYRDFECIPGLKVEDWT